MNIDIAGWAVILLLVVGGLMLVWILVRLLRRRG